MAKIKGHLAGYVTKQIQQNINCTSDQGQQTMAHGPNPAHGLLCMTHELRVLLTFLNVICKQDY